MDFLNIRSDITDDYGDSYRVVIDLEATADVENWRLNLPLPEGHSVLEIYGGRVATEGESDVIVPSSWVNKMANGDRDEIVIVVSGNAPSSSSLPFKATAADPAYLINPEPDLVTTEGNLKISTIFPDGENWGNEGYRVIYKVEALADAPNWQSTFNLPEGHRITAAYGMEVFSDTGNVTVAGDNWNINLEAGQVIEGVFIVEGDFEQFNESIATESFEPVESAATKESDSGLVSGVDSIQIESQISNDWEGGYELKLDVSAVEDAQDWQASFELPSGYSITDVRGADISTSGNSFTIDGAGYNSSLQKGQSTEVTLVVDDNNSEAINPEFTQGIGEAVVADLTETDSFFAPISVDNNNMGTAEGVNFEFGGAIDAGQQGDINYGEALQKNFLFFEANRSGRLPANNRIEWRSDSTFNDGADVGKDLNGGYFDAGDHMKFSQPMGFSMTQLAWSGVDYKEAYQQSGQLDELLEAVKWGTDYFLKCHERDGQGKTTKLYVQVADASDHAHWVPPEEITNRTGRPSFAIDRNNPGSDVAAGIASALASASMLFEGIDDAYSQTLLDNAIALFEFADTYRGRYSDSVSAANPFYTSWSGYEDELALGAAWLYRATGDNSYLTKAENQYKSKVGGSGDWSYATDDHGVAALALLAKESGDGYFRQELQRNLAHWVNGTAGVKYTPGGLAVRTNWASVPLAAAAAYVAQFYSDYVENNQSYEDFARRQIDYILGKNPRNYSYMVGFGDDYPIRSHHRGSAGSVSMSSSKPNQYILYGAIVGGPGSADDYSHNDRRDDWVTNEVGTSYNAPVAAALAQMYSMFGGNPLSDGELDSLEGVRATESELSLSIPSPIEDEFTSSPLSNTPVSANAFQVGFEGHGDGSVYGRTAQGKDWDVKFSSDDMDNFARITDKEAYSGNSSLQITYPSDRQLNAGAGWNLPPEKEYYVSYKVKFADDFEFNGRYSDTSGGKLPGLGADGLCSGGQTCTGTNGFTSRPMWRENGEAVLYLYHMDKPGTYGEDIPLGRSFEKGKWHNITQRVRVNDGTQSNGEVDVWMDGQQVLSRDNLRFMTDDGGIDTMFFNTFHGGYGDAWWPSQNVEAYFDDFVVSPNPGDVGR